MTEAGILNGTSRYTVTAKLWQYVISESKTRRHERNDRLRNTMMVILTIVLATATVFQAYVFFKDSGINIGF